MKKLIKSILIVITILLLSNAVKAQSANTDSLLQKITALEKRVSGLESILKSDTLLYLPSIYPKGIISIYKPDSANWSFDTIPFWKCNIHRHINPRQGGIMLFDNIPFDSYEIQRVPGILIDRGDYIKNE